MHAIIVHGAHGRGDALADAPLDLLAATRTETSAAVSEQGHAALARALPNVAVTLTVRPTYRVGWLPPSVFQQSLLSGAVLVWGDAAVVRAIPAWRPESIDPRASLGEMDAAERDLATGHAALAVVRAAGALLLAKRRYEPRRLHLPEALRAAWPEVPPLPSAGDATSAAVFVSDARRRLHDWLFTWEGSGVSAGAIEAYQSLLRSTGISGARVSTRG